MKKTRGFTIVEMLIYMGILTTMMVILTRMLTGIIDMQLGSEAAGEIEEDSRYVFARLAYDIGRATNIVTPAAAGDQSSMLILSIDGVANTYALSGNSLVLANNHGTHDLTGYGSEISNVMFTRLGDPSGKNSIQVAFTIDSLTQTVSGSDSKTLETTIVLR